MEEKNTAGQVQYQPVIAILGGMSILSRLRHHPTLCSGMSFLKKLKRENEHWAVLGMSRSEYAVKRPWKVAGVSCVTFEDVTVLVPGEVIADLKFHAEAELLLENVFSKELCSTNERPCPVLTVILDR